MPSSSSWSATIELCVCARYLLVSGLPVALARAWTTMVFAPESRARFAASAIVAFASSDRFALNSSKYTRKRGIWAVGVFAGVCALAAVAAVSVTHRKVNRQNFEIPQIMACIVPLQ